MKATIKTLFVTLLALIVMDFGVANFLNWSKANNRLGSLTNYFDLGLSVPAKIEAWAIDDNVSGNLYQVAWPQAILMDSTQKSAFEPDDHGRTIRNYGMSFSGNISEKAMEIDPSFSVDNHAGPAAPTNHSYMLFVADRENRNPGDVVVFGILSSSVPNIAAMSNRTWLFEQPAPYTYPIYYPEGEGLRRVDPFIGTLEKQAELEASPGLQRAWRDQLAEHDRFYSPLMFEWRSLDRSPLVRLIRRAATFRLLSQRDQQVLQDNEYPTLEVLRRMLVDVKNTAIQDGQIPVILLIQTNNPSDIDLRGFLAPTLREIEIPYVATADYFDPKDSSGFVGDGHYSGRVDKIFGQALLDVIEEF